tara:strand:+ start:53 stop:1045 length:993 start_codon:yes stop_codon:yes gene_type:complete
VEKIVITGACGFIGFNFAKSLSKEVEIIGIDSLNDAYDPKLKYLRLNELEKNKNFNFFELNLSNKKFLEENIQLFNDVDLVLHLGARAGVRQSYLEPNKYIDDNTSATTNLAMLTKKTGIKRFIIASTSSIYGDTGEKFAVENQDELTDPPSIYAATKMFGETMVKNILSDREYIIQIPRFFTVYGPYGRPDMSILRFIHWIASKKEVILYGSGEQRRSFTYIDDIVEGLNKLCKFEESGTFNFGSNITWSLNEVISKIEEKLNIKANVTYKERAFRDVDIVLPSLENSKTKLGWEPTTNMNTGLDKTIEWYKKYENDITDIKFKYDYEK